MKAAIFDLDGTLIDSMPVWDGVWERFCVKYSPVRDEELFAEYKARTLESAIDFYKARLSIPAGAGELRDEVNGYVLEGYAGVEPKRGAVEYLGRLQRVGIPACVATNTVRPLVEYVLRRLGLEDKVRFILTCSEFGSGKDRPDIFFECARRLGAEPAETFVFEDAPHALKTAHDAGFGTCGIWDRSYSAAEAELRKTADRYIRDFADLVDFPPAG